MAMLMGGSGVSGHPCGGRIQHEVPAEVQWWGGRKRRKKKKQKRKARLHLVNRKNIQEPENFSANTWRL